ncbi:MAG: DNA polymerase III subunit delta' [Chloroflexota bacterium]|nr:DNA polymerase III subunit delta' [Chloroflexota bacterium]
MNHWGIIGHQHAVQQMQLAVKRQEVPHALLITGPDSVGKRTFALKLAQTMHCTAENAEQRPCDQCSACRRVNSGNYPDLRVITPEEGKRGVKIDPIRALIQFLTLTPIESQYKIGIITTFEHIVPNAANALLKTLEEPPSYAHLILLATDAELLLPTIVSRCCQITLRPLSRPEIVAGLVAQRGSSPEEARRLARLSGGRVGWAIRALQQPEFLRRQSEALQLLFKVLQSELPTRFDLAQELARDALQVRETLDYWQASWRDVLLLQTGNADQITYLEERTTLEEIAGTVTLDVTAQILQRLTTALEDLFRNANTRLLVESLFLNLPQLQNPN